MERWVTASIITIIVTLSGSTGYFAYTYTVAHAPQPPASQKPELRVFIAASLINVVQNVSKQFEDQYNCTVVFNSGGSDQLYQQIYSGSPCDVFMAADFKWTNLLKSEKLLHNNQYWNFTTNKLVVIMPADNPKNITSLIDLVKPGVKVIAAAYTVPVGSYTNKTLTKIETTWGNPSSPKYKGAQWQYYRENIITNTISYEPNVENIVGKIKLGIGDAGFAYISDVIFQGNSIKYLKIPDDVNTKGTYGLAVVSNSAHRDLANEYVQFWLSNQGQALLNQFGFGTDIQ